MYLDKTLEFCDSESIAGATGTALIGDVVDLGEAGREIEADHLDLYITVQTKVDSAADGATVQFILASDAQAAIATNGTATVHYASEVFTEAELVQGAKIVAKLPGGTIPAAERYLGILAVRAGEAVTAGAINAGLTPTAPKWSAKAANNGYV